MMTFAAVLQLLVALSFVSIPLVRHRYGPRATDAAHAELRRQGVSPGVLADNGMRFDASGHESAVPVAVALVMTALAVLNLTGSPLGGTLSWALQPVVLAGNLVILYSQLTAARSVEAAFARKGDPELARIDVRALLRAAESGFPSWVMPGLQNVRHALVMGGSALVLLALALA
ncbi:hypothetical protein MF672_015510 [Actinomadura sp. ATCC 31491]|uniref:DUF1772 domain-containing protein n=1 Tax=Actinomadura luzonensis TaxID=2805427 RepID=A0ABT0FS67_9ACTN|nr:hypothetical protein [Actinomadura luzonensis]MCK2215183.1 hypothetical protein [Actinomadura luzonensis]